MFCAPRVNHFQAPPFERPGGDEVLLLRWYRDGEEPSGESNLWRLPTVGEFEHPGELEPWTDSTFLARVDAPFNPPDIPDRDFFWCIRDFAIDIAPRVYAPGVLPALRRFDGPLIDQIMARIEARADSNSHGDSAMSTTIQDLQRQVAELQRKLGPPAEGREKFIEAQSKAEAIYHAYGDSAPGPLAGERLYDYRVRLASKYQTHSKKFKDVNLGKCGDPSVLSVVEDSIFADAMTALRAPAGRLRQVETKDASGRPITRYYGDPGDVWDLFNPPVRYVRRFMTPGQ
jgi:hypothetical protein